MSEDRRDEGVKDFKIVQLFFYNENVFVSL